MVIPTHSSNTTQAAEALLDRARRLSHHAYERAQPPTAFAEGENPSFSRHINATMCSSSSPHHSYNSQPRDASKRSSFASLTRRRSATNSSSVSSSSTASVSPRSSSPTNTPPRENVQLDASGASSAITTTPRISSCTSSKKDQPVLIQSPVKEVSEGITPRISVAVSNVLLDPSRAFTSACATITTTTTTTTTTTAAGSSQHLSPCLSSAARPRALTLESIREVRGSETDLDERASRDQQQQQQQHRKHLSENGNSLVYGVLAALRQSTELEFTLASNRSGLYTIAPKMVSSTSCHSSFPSAKNQPTEPTGCSPSASSTVTKNSTTNAESSDAAGLESSSLNIEQIPVPDASIIQTIETEVPVIDEAKGILSNSSSVPSTVAKEEGGVPERATMTAESLATLSSSSSNKQADSDKKEGKGAYLLHKMGVRKNSFTEGSDFSATDVGHLSARTSLNKGSKRSSKLLNKIVPKFLQTSPMSPTPSNASSAGTGASIGTSGGSPRSQSSGLSPFSTRSSRSASVNSQSPAHKNEADAAVISIALSRSVSLLSKSSQRSLPLVDSEAKPTAEEADQAAFPSTTTPATPLITMSASTPPTFLECLRSGTVGSSNTSLGRRSSCSSVMSKRSDYSSLSRPSGSSMSSLDSAEDDIRGSSSGIKAMQSVYAIQVEYEEADAEVDQADDQEYNRNATATTVEDNCAADDPPLSPYIIDEDCDDDFFLNSVLRKKSQPPTLQLQEKQRNDVGHWYPVMESSYPSNTTLDSMHSTPSLSGWSNSSSRNSTPSPTSPVFMSGQDDEFSTGSSSNSSVTKTGGGHLHYRSNPLPMPIHSGLDEKRCRLREAVSEWRRSANASF